VNPDPLRLGSRKSPMAVSAYPQEVSSPPYWTRRRPAAEWWCGNAAALMRAEKTNRNDAHD